MLAVLAAYPFLWQKVLAHVDLTIAYVSKGMLVVWTLIWAVLLFNEPIAFNHVCGTVFISVGVAIDGGE